MKKDQRVRTSLSAGQWKKIERSIPNASKKNIRQYINTQLIIIGESCRTLPDIEDCTDCQQERKFSLSPGAYSAIERIKRKTGIKDPSTIISKFIIPQLLINKVDINN